MSYIMLSSLSSLECGSRFKNCRALVQWQNFARIFNLNINQCQKQASGICGCLHVQYCVMQDLSCLKVVLEPHLSAQAVYYWLSCTITQLATLSANKWQMQHITGKYWCSMYPTCIEWLSSELTLCLTRDNERHCCFRCPFDWTEGLTVCVKDFKHCFKTGSVVLQ